MPPQPSSLALREQAILLVDDEPEILATLSALLRRAMPRAEIRTAGGAEEGLRLVTDRAFDVVMSDHRMPGVTGIEFLRRVRDVRPDTIRILMTAYPEMDLAIRGLNERIVDRFVTKPFHGRDVVEAVTTLIEARQTRLLQEHAFARSFDVLRRQVMPGSP